MPQSARTAAAIPPGSGGPYHRQVSRTWRLQVVLLLNLGLITALAIVGLAAHSPAVLAAGADYLAEAGGIGVSLLAIWLAGRPIAAAWAVIPARRTSPRWSTPAGFWC